MKKKKKKKFSVWIIRLDYVRIEYSVSIKKKEKKKKKNRRIL